ncbi:MAG TPA: P1 family peptidase [Steroidobacteraceae bacterium]|nr:P1 family peptidase [Steroidobacteraceae bacterium]
MHRFIEWALLGLLLPVMPGLCASDGVPQPALRARALGVPFEGTPGPHDAVTDVAGVEVGQVTRISGEGLLRVGSGPVRTGVTVVLPRGRKSITPVYGGFFNLNGDGEMTGQSYLQDFGVVSGPIGISNTNAIGQVYAGIMQWSQRNFGSAVTPVVAETDDEWLNDLGGFHVQANDAVEAIEAARAGAVAEGNVGGGTGMVCFGFKGGIGTASRLVDTANKRYTVGVLVQCNTGDRTTLRIAGAPVGAALSARWLPCYVTELSPAGKRPKCTGEGAAGKVPPDRGSIIIVVATDAPLIPTQLNRLARRAALGLGRLGSYSGNGSGDLVVSFSTAVVANDPDKGYPAAIAPVPNPDLDPLFKGVVEASEEAVVNALVAARTMTGADGRRFFALPHDELQAILKRYGRLAPGAPASVH